MSSLGTSREDLVDLEKIQEAERTCAFCPPLPLRDPQDSAGKDPPEWGRSLLQPQRPVLRDPSSPPEASWEKRGEGGSNWEEGLGVVFLPESNQKRRVILENVWSQKGKKNIIIFSLSLSFSNKNLKKTHTFGGVPASRGLLPFLKNPFLLAELQNAKAQTEFRCPLLSP